MKLTRLNIGRCIAAACSIATLAVTGITYGAGIATAAPEGVPVGGFVHLGLHTPRCDNPSTPHDDSIGFVEASGRSALDMPVSLRLEQLETNGVWSNVSDDGVEAFVNGNRVDGHSALWAHVDLERGDVFAIRHHGPLDGHVTSYRLLMWPEGATKPQVRIDELAALYPSPGFCREADLAQP